MNKKRIFIPAAATLTLGLAIAAQAQPVAFTVENGSFAADQGAVIGWDTSSAEGRANGPFGGTIAHQGAIDSADDPNQGSGSLLYTFTAASGSLSQQILVTDTGQTIESFSVDLAHDGSFVALVVGFYQESIFDIYAGGSTEVIAANVPADTDGTLDEFQTVTIPAFETPNTNSPIRIFVGTSATGAYGGATANVSQFAIDNVRVNTGSNVSNWMMY